MKDFLISVTTSSLRAFLLRRGSILNDEIFSVSGSSSGIRRSPVYGMQDGSTFCPSICRMYRRNGRAGVTAAFSRKVFRPLFRADSKPGRAPDAHDPNGRKGRTGTGYAGLEPDCTRGPNRFSPILFLKRRKTTILSTGDPESVGSPLICRLRNDNPGTPPRKFFMESFSFPP